MGRSKRFTHEEKPLISKTSGIVPDSVFSLTKHDFPMLIKKIPQPDMNQ